MRPGFGGGGGGVLVAAGRVRDVGLAGRDCCVSSLTLFEYVC